MGVVLQQLVHTALVINGCGIRTLDAVALDGHCPLSKADGTKGPRLDVSPNSKLLPVNKR
jgi:hypothetical protein